MKQGLAVVSLEHGGEKSRGAFCIQRLDRQSSQDVTRFILPCLFFWYIYLDLLREVLNSYHITSVLNLLSGLYEAHQLLLLIKRH